MRIFEILFFSSLTGIFFAYIGYPATLALLKLFVGNNLPEKADIFPAVSFMIVAYNEEKNLKRKIDNTINLEYPGEKLEIIVGSDGSTDRTAEIARSYGDRGVKFLEVKEHKGKEFVQIELMKAATGEIFVFSDVATIIEREGLKIIVSNFNDEKIGCVSSEDRLLSHNGKFSGENYYIKYEMLLRRLESAVSSLVGLSGSFFAVRRIACRGNIQPDNDFKIALNAVEVGFRAISDPDVIGYYYDVMNDKSEYSRKVRTVIRGFAAFFNNLNMLNFTRYGMFSYQLLCHKLLRWTVPFFMLTALLSNLVLIRSTPLYAVLFFFQALVYLLWAYGSLITSPRSHPVIKASKYLVNVNLAIFIAWIRFLKGERIQKWEPSPR